FGPWMSALRPRLRIVALDAASSDGVETLYRFMDQGRQAEPAALRDWLAAVDGTQPCLMVFTSGSTGAPKGVMISQTALIGASLVQLRQWPAQPLRVLNNLPINHIGCVGDLGCYALVGGGALIFRPRFEPDLIPDVIA